MRSAWTFLIGASIVAGCGGGSTGSPSPGMALAYTVPTPNPLQYEFADTAWIAIDMSGTQVDINAEAAGTIEARFEPAANGVTAEIRYQSLSGRFANSMAGTITVGDSDLPGAATLIVDRRGQVTVSSLPEASGAFRQVLGSEGAFRRLFVRLPGRAVAPGTTWTDTVTVSENIGEMNSSSTSIVTSTLAGDTIVGGRTMLVIRSDIEGTTRIAGQTQGFEVRQQFQGTSTAVTLWDPDRRAVVERVETGSAAGTMELPAMGMAGIPLTMGSSSTMRLRQP